jgi:hypothetical protein
MFNGLRPLRQARLPPVSVHERLLVGARFEKIGIPLCSPPVCLPSWPFGTAIAAPEGVYIRACYRFVTSSAVEYATRPTGQLPGLDFHQQEKQPCRLHPETEHGDPPFSAARRRPKGPGLARELAAFEVLAACKHRARRSESGLAKTSLA